MPSTVQGAPLFGPLSHVPASPMAAPVQRGQIWTTEVRWTLADTFTVAWIAPVRTLAVPPMPGSENPSTTHAGTPADRRGNGGPKVEPLGPVTVQRG